MLTVTVKKGKTGSVANNEAGNADRYVYSDVDNGEVGKL